MDKTNTWLIRVFAVVLVFVCLIAYLNAQANSSLLRPTIEDLEYKASVSYTHLTLPTIGDV